MKNEQEMEAWLRLTEDQRQQEFLKTHFYRYILPTYGALTKAFHTQMGWSPYTPIRIFGFLVGFKVCFHKIN
jgi:hypothetical protein